MVGPGWLLLVSVLAVSAGACAGRPLGPELAAGGAPAVPAAALSAVRARWPEAELGRSTSATCPGSEAPAAAEGDFNGDGAADLAVWFSVDGMPRLGVLLARLADEYTLVEIDPDSTARPVTFDVALRGTPYRLATLTVVDFFGADTVVLRECDGRRTAWFWTGQAFRPQLLAN